MNNRSTESASETRRTVVALGTSLPADFGSAAVPSFWVRFPIGEEWPSSGEPLLVRIGRAPLLAGQPTATTGPELGRHRVSAAHHLEVTSGKWR